MTDPGAVTIGMLAATALSWAAEAMLKGAAGEAVKDTYSTLKHKVKDWAGNDIKALEAAPSSEGRKMVIAEQIDRQPAREQEAVHAFAVKLIEALEYEGMRTQPILTVKANHGSVAAGGDITGNTITTNSIDSPK